MVINVAGEPHAEVYGHLKRKATVRQGENVKTGERIGKVGDDRQRLGLPPALRVLAKGSRPRRHVTKQLKAWDKYS